MMSIPSRFADTATAPRMRKYEHVQRRAERSPSASFTVNCTAPQWQAPFKTSKVVFILVSILGIQVAHYTVEAATALPGRGIRQRRRALGASQRGSLAR